MANPFLRRATEYIRDDASFLAIVSPSPLTTFLAKHPRRDDLFDVPVRIVGAPGSGKTMLATLAEFRLVEAIMRDQTSPTNRDLASALDQAGFLRDGRPSVAAVRLPMESEYRDFWELPYDDGVKTKLVLWLLQARTILGLIRNLTAGGRRDLDGIRFVPREGAETRIEDYGGVTAVGMQDRALRVQRAISSIGAGLVAPRLEDLPSEATAPYQPFEAIRAIEIDWDGEPLQLSPLAMLDDVHALHPMQFEQIFVALARREIKFGRWMMMRLDALSPGTVLQSPENLETHNLKPDRDFINVFMQGREDRTLERRQFRTMAADMANRYLPLVQALKTRNATQFSALVPTQPPAISDAKYRDLLSAAERDQKRLGITTSRRASIDALVAQYIDASPGYDRQREVAVAMSRILMHRYANRVASVAPSLFEEFDPEPSTPLKAGPGVAEAARLHLNEDYGRPLHYGLENLCDASNENAELFLQLAGTLVARMETRAIRGKQAALPAEIQQEALREKAREIMDGWSFAYARRVRALVDAMARDCRAVSLLPNARLDAGANAFGIPEGEIRALLETQDDTASILKFAVAHGAIVVQRDYGQGSRNWCLIELSGIVCLAHGLTLKRGGFLERRVDQLATLSA
ncbi:hypothetical protein [Sphingomonas sp. CFBP 13706]|uniref:hypothetical protein n=1 Tax=Sphingomonas sp. CFBP 13706 TaxID=2775314 RepID=UPI001782B87B|nr:hypothetical protein [Sphingomonas sp. CFBP 13706]MBD8736229.1 hypothetical protein [Sphingomonas sp. CFBP 13706]